MSRIITTFELKPIPIRCCDWTAAREDYDGGDPLGVGATEQAAIDDLLEQEAMRAEG